MLICPWPPPPQSPEPPSPRSRRDQLRQVHRRHHLPAPGQIVRSVHSHVRPRLAEAGPAQVLAPSRPHPRARLLEQADDIADSQVIALHDRPGQLGGRDLRALKLIGAEESAGTRLVLEVQVNPLRAPLAVIAAHEYRRPAAPAVPAQRVLPPYAPGLERLPNLLGPSGRFDE